MAVIGIAAATAKDTLDVTGATAGGSLWVETVATYEQRTGQNYAGSSEILLSNATGNILVEMAGIEEIALHGSSGNDTIVISGNFSGTALLPSTVYVFGDAGDDQVSISRGSAVDVQVDGGADTDTVVLDFAYSDINNIDAITGGLEITHNGNVITDQFTSIENFVFTDGSTLSFDDLLNGPPVLDSASLTLSEGQTAALSAANFGITDPDSTDFTYTVSGVTGGIFQLSTAAGVSITSFSSADLAAGLVQFVDDGNEVAPSFSVTVNDGASDSNTLAATINYTPANDPPVLTGDLAATVAEGGTITITTTNLNFTDPDDVASGVTLTVNTQVNGTVLVSGSPATTFTGTQLAANQVSFQHDGTQTTAASFAVSVEDGNEDGSAPVAQTFNLTVTPANDPPVITPGGDISGAVIEDTTLSTSGHLDATDADSGAVLAWTLQGGAAGEVATNLIGNVDYTFTIDQLDIFKNGANIYSDDFGDGDPPPSGVTFTNGNPGTYATSGVFTETGGGAVMDGSLAGPTQSALFTSVPYLGHFASLLTNASNDPNPPNIDSGLKIDDDFTVDGRFDLTILDENGEGYGIRLSDRGGPDNQLGDDVMELMVLRTSNGDLRVIFRERDFVAGEVNNIQSTLLDPTGADQIVLRLDHQAANPGVVTASFDLLSGGTVIDTVTFGNTGQIFGTETPGTTADDELWTRAQIIAFSPGEVVGSSLVGDYGTLSIDQNGDWTYQLDNGSLQVQALAAGQQVTDTFTAVVADEFGATDMQQIAVTVTGVDEPVLGLSLTNTTTTV